MMQQLFQQGRKHIYSLFICTCNVRNTCATTIKTLLQFVALQQCATCPPNMILAVKEEKAKTSVQQCLQQVQLVVFLLQLSLSSPVIMPKFSISDAAKRAKVERKTLYRKLNKGEISAEIDAHGSKVIDASELFLSGGDSDRQSGDKRATDAHGGNATKRNSGCNNGGAAARSDARGKNREYEAPNRGLLSIPMPGCSPLRCGI